MDKHENKNLFGKTKDELRNIVTSLGEAAFRGNQLYDFIYKKKVSSFSECHNLPRPLIEKLANSGYTISLPEIITVQTDPEDNTKKFLMRLEDGELVECVLMEYPHGLSACLSTQVGCAMGCSFCASGKNGKVRNLTAPEIAGQIVSMENYVDEPVSNIVLMGMGEPLDNFDNVTEFIELANKDLNIGQRHITLSTCGLVPEIKRLADMNYQINLAISLHSPFQEERERIMPIAKRYPVSELIEAAQEYQDKTGRRVTYEYTVIDGVNDREADSKELAKLLLKSIHHINLIPLNPVTKSKQKRTNNVNVFSDLLKKQGLTCTIRKKNGANIDAACGQLRNRELEK